MPSRNAFSHLPHACAWRPTQENLERDLICIKQSYTYSQRRGFCARCLYTARKMLRLYMQIIAQLTWFNQRLADKHRTERN
jgi:hypothetical protein